GVTDNHGHADWMTMREARKEFPGPHPAYGGVVVGEAYRVDQNRVPDDRFDPQDKRTWGDGGCAPLLIDPACDGPTHSLVFAGSGGFKTTAAISTILEWHGSSVVHDPSCEVGHMVAAALRRQGKRVFFLDPKRPDQVARWGFNALDWIDVEDELA